MPSKTNGRGALAPVGADPAVGRREVDMAIRIERLCSEEFTDRSAYRRTKAQETRCCDRDTQSDWHSELQGGVNSKGTCRSKV